MAQGIPLPSGMDRRQFLKVAGLGAAALALGAPLAACSGGTNSHSTTAKGKGPSGKAVRGGHLRIGGSGGASSDVLDPHVGTTNTDYVRLPQLFDVLVKLKHDGSGVNYLLAESITPNAEATKWTIKVRRNAVCHDGSPFGAADVLWNFKRIMDGKMEGAVPLGSIDIGKSRIIDDKTLELAFKTPFAILVDVLAGLPFYYMASKNWTKRNNLGTGPFTLKSFQPGVSSVTIRFDKYWQPGKPYLDQITTLDMADETTQVNALNGGQVDAIDFLSAESVRLVQQQNFQVVVSKTRGWAPITMACNDEPFTDVRVRQALRLLVDRDQINRNVYGGYGTIANDVFGVTTDPTAGLPQRKRDVATAKQLLEQAGKQNLNLTIISNDVVPAQKSVATLFAEQVKAANVNIKVDFQAATTFFAKSYLKVPFAQDYWYYVPYLANVAGATVSTAPFNATHFNDKAYDALYEKAIATVAANERDSLIKQMQRIDYDRGGNIIPVFYPVIDALSTKVGGIVPDVSGFPFGNNTFQDVWIAQ